MGAFDGLIGQGLGMILDSNSDERQIKQQQRFTDMQMAANKEMTKFNREQAMQMWKDTNYGAQIDEMKKSGLSEGLIYGMKGGGGVTTSMPSSNVGSGTAENMGMKNGMGMQLGLQAAMTEAQTRLIEAQTQKTEVETEKTAGVDTELTSAMTTEKVEAALRQQMENNYMGKGAYSDGMSGYEVRAQREAAEMYNTVARTELEKLRVEQMPKELANEVQRVVLEGQRVAIEGMNARTQQERNNITREVEALKRSLAIQLQGNEMYMRAEDQAISREGMNRSNEQKDEDQILGVVDKVLSSVIPWYEPATTTTTTTDGQRWNDGSYRTETRTERRK